LVNVKIVNVVASTKLDNKLDIETIYSNLDHVQYEPDTFPGLVYRREKPKATIIMFSTGTVVSTGTTSEKKAKTAIDVTINEIGIKVYPQISIENITAVATLGKSIDMEDLQLIPQLDNKVIYEPEMFPGAIYKSKDATMLIFHTGKIVVTGTKSKKQTLQAVESLVLLL